MTTTPPPSAAIDSDLIRTLAAVLDETKLTEIEYDAHGIRIRIVRQAAPVAAIHHAAPAPVALAPAGTPQHDEANNANAVLSPMVGVVYLSPDPGSPKFADVGATVHEGQTLLLIEAMKTFNPILATRSGKVTRILVTDGQPVEFGEPLVIVE